MGAGLRRTGNGRTVNTKIDAVAAVIRSHCGVGRQESLITAGAVIAALRGDVTPAMAEAWSTSEMPKDQPYTDENCARREWNALLHAILVDSLDNPQR